MKRRILQCKSFTYFLFGALVLSSLLSPGSYTHAQGSMFTEKPFRLLPENTEDRDYKTKVQLKGMEISDIMKVIVEAPTYNMTGVFGSRGEGEMYAEAKIWHEGAVHEIINELEMAGFQFKPEEGSVLTFSVEKERGYVFVEGKGTVWTSDGEIIELDFSKKGAVFGVPGK